MIPSAPMAFTDDALERHLDRLSRRWERTEDGTYLIASGAAPAAIALRAAGPVLVARIGIGPVGAGGEPLLRRLLEFNAQKLLHAAYGLEGEVIVLSAALETENLDTNELEAVLEDVDLALAEQVPELLALSGGK